MAREGQLLAQMEELQAKVAGLEEENASMCVCVCVCVYCTCTSNVPMGIGSTLCCSLD